MFENSKNCVSYYSSCSVGNNNKDLCLKIKPLNVNKNGFTVACGTQALEVSELQLEGKKRMAAGDFLRGYQLETGKRFVNGRD